MDGQKARKPILLIKTGGTIKDIATHRKDFEHWFSLYMGVGDFLQIDVFQHQPLPSPDAVSGVVITGSAAMVSDREIWSEATADWLSKAVAQGTPVLGVCYGHQLLAHALGGKVGRNPNGRQIGTVETRLTEYALGDRLTGHLPQVFFTQATHQESVLAMPPGAVRLATSPKDENFAIRFSETTWGVQFHPEFSAPVMADYIRYRSSALEGEGLDSEKLLNEVRDTPEARSVLTTFKSVL